MLSNYNINFPCCLTILIDKVKAIDFKANIAFSQFFIGLLINKQRKDSSWKRMEPAFNRIQKLRISQRFLSRDQFKTKQMICCCFSNVDDQEDHRFHLFDPISRHEKISMKRVKKLSQKGISYSNSDLSIGKFSQKSILPVQGKAMTSTKFLSSINLLDHSDNRVANRPQHGKITFAYSTNINPQYSHQPTLQSYHSQTVLSNGAGMMQAKSINKIFSQPVLEQNIENQFNNVLGFGDTYRQELKCGEAFTIANKKGDQLQITNYRAPNLSHFSFGQHQKEQFMNKFQNYRLQNGVIKTSLNQQAALQPPMRNLIQQKQSKSSKSSGAAFAKGTFNANNLNSLSRGRNLMYQYKSQSQISLESSQSLVIQSYQNVMKKKENHRRLD